MSLLGKHVIAILGVFVFVLISLGSAYDEGNNKVNLGQCLGKCGDDLVYCMLQGHIWEVENLMACVKKCEGTNVMCMDK